MRFFLPPAIAALCCTAVCVSAAPTVSVVSPAPGTTVSSLTTVSITFSEAVTGVNATDLGVNGELADSVTGSGSGPYVFTFPQPPAGQVSLAWDVDQSIAGLGTGEFVPAGGWIYTLADTLAPELGKVRTTVAGQEMDAVRPAPGSTVGSVTQAVVSFSETVTGVSAADLLVNGTPAAVVTGEDAGPYVFTFTQPATGAVNFTWAAGHGIVDAAANAFPGTGWSITLGTPGQVVITEFLAANGGSAVAAGSDADGTRDENWDLSPWIELHNPGTTDVDLRGWRLTDDPEDSARWIFPARTLAAGARLIVWASEKDRKPVTGNLHTNFALNPNGGSVLLFPPDEPASAPASAWVNYPPQRYDYSYGAQAGDGLPRYFRPPSITQGAYTVPTSDGVVGTLPPAPAGAVNGTSTLISLTPEPTMSVNRGFFTQPFSVILSCADATATIRYTLDGSPPLASSPAYSAPVSVTDTTVLRAAAFGTDKVPSLTVTHTYLFPDNVTNQPSPPYAASTADATRPQPPSVGGSKLPIAWGTNGTFTAAQTITGWPTGTNTGANNLSAGQIPADYGMDPKVWADPNKYDDAGAIDAAGKTNLERIRTALRTLPALSVVMKGDTMFGAYPNGTIPAGVTDPLYPTSSASIKRDMTKPCSMEMMQADGTTVFVTEAGIDLHGNASRDPFKNPKHGFTIRFKGRYGAGKLEANLYPDSPVREWDKLVLRGDFGGSWMHQNGGDTLSVSNDSSQRPRGIRIREAFCKDTFRDMGGAASHHRFCSLFINGVCWGTYELMEDEAEDFGSSYFGGSKDDYDVVDQGKLKSGTWNAWSAMKLLLGWTGGTTTTDRTTAPTNWTTAITNTQYETLRTMLDLPWFQDYMIHHLYFGHRDWATAASDAGAYMKNVYFIRPKNGTYKVMPWDMENLMWHQDEDRVTGMTTFASAPSLQPPAAIHPRAKTNPEYRLEFADRAWRHMVRPGGALTPPVITARLDKWTSVMGPNEICLESARWGDYRYKTHAYTTGTVNQVYTWNGAWYDGTGAGYSNGTWTSGSTKFNTGRTLATLGTWTSGMANAWIDEIRRLKTAYYPVRADNVLWQFRTNGLFPYTSAPVAKNALTSSVLSDGQVPAGTQVSLVNADAPGTLNGSTIYYTLNGPDPRPQYDTAGTPRAEAVAYSAPFTINAPTLIRARAWNPGGTAVSAAYSVRAGSAANVVVIYASTGGTSARGRITAAPNALDGITLAAGDRVLLKNQTTGAQNGIWVVTAPGTGSNGTWDRATDWDADGEAKGGMLVRTAEGTANAAKYWRVTNTTAIIVGGATGSSVTFAGHTPVAEWSALMEITLNVGAPVPTVAISEINYNPRNTQGGTAAEYVEFHNYGALPVTMTTWYMDGIDFIFPAGFVLEPGQRVVIANNENPTTFAAQYPGVVVLGYYGGSLSNSGERISLRDTAGRIVSSVEFDDTAPWPTSPDNGGYALELIDPAGDPQSAANWRASTALKGTPGTAGTAPAAVDVILSEFFARPSSGPDFVELHNRGTAAADVSGWRLRIYQNDATTLPPGTAIPAGGYLAVRASGAQPVFAAGVELFPNSGSIYLLNGSATVVDGVRYGPQSSGLSFSRISGVWTLSAPTAGAANIAAPMAPLTSIRLNEWRANPRAGESDWIEFYCQSSNDPAVLTGCTIEVNGAPFTIDVPVAVDDENWAVLDCDPGATRADAVLLSLPAEGGTIRLLDPAGQVLDSITYTEQPESVSGGRIPDGGAAISSSLTPSPGLTNDPGLNVGGLHLSEVMVLNRTGATAPWARRPAWIELGNSPGAAQGLAGWKLRTIGTSPVTFTFPAATTIAAEAYVRVWCDESQPASTANGSHLNTGFSLDPDAVWGVELLYPSGHLYLSLTWGTQIPDKSLGRSGFDFKLLSSPTPGAANSAAATIEPAASAKLNEWYGAAGTGVGNFVELYNPGSVPMDIGGLWLGDSPSESGRRRWQVPEHTFIPAGSHLLFTSSGPAGHPTVLPFGIAQGGEYLRLSADDAPGTLIDEQNFPGFASLVSQGRLSDGTATVTVMNPTPGFSNAAAGGQIITEHPQSIVISGGSAVTFSVTAPGATSWQWKRNGTDIPGAVGGTYAVQPFASPATAGTYTVSVTGPGGTALSQPATLTVLNNFSTFATVYGITADPNADPDGDGVSNAVEFLTGGNPLVPSSPAQRALQAAPFYSPGPGSAMLGFDLALDPNAVFTSLLGDASPDLSAWQARSPDSSATIPGGTRLLWNVPAGEDRYFLRLKLTP